ncbi:uncharacterized protein LOC133824911 [Humulus lupulus]|uniref:uncharacterized protein LOC133824911 n=1 Tax=Humulus lupulus TaxID=3486 RepID=UPI002B40DB05|nr:uncharacterized protein LOC133824911 [Humulus lupulus]
MPQASPLVSSSQPQRPLAPHKNLNELQDVLLTLTNTQTRFLNETRSSIRNMKMQMGHLVNMINNRPQGNSPSTRVMNPREHCQDITLKSGKQYDEPTEGVVSKENVLEEHEKENEFKKLHINIPFTDALEQMPSYEKFKKDILFKKRNMEEYETVALMKDCCAILQRKLPPKLRDAGSFTIEAQPSTITLQLEDRSVKHQRGIIEDVLVKVDKFIFLANFIVLDMEEDANISIILGRSILATGKALIDVQKYELKLRVQGDEVVFNVFKAMNYSKESGSCCSADVIEGVVSVTSLVNDFLELSHAILELKEVVYEAMEYFNWINSYGPYYNKKFEELGKGPEKTLPFIEKPPVLELKSLPDHLQYAYLGEKDTLPVIVSSSLSNV